jgi:DNA-binding beta-propeller fold protein YncE
MTTSVGFRKAIWPLTLLVLLAVPCTALAERRVIKKIPVGGEYGWDYLTADSDARRLYVSHDREVVVLDLDSGALIGKIPGKGVHGIAVAKEFGRGFISCSDPGSVVIFDLKTLAVIDRVPVGDDPNVIRSRSTQKTTRFRSGYQIRKSQPAVQRGQRRL